MEIVLIVEDDSLVGDGNEDFLSRLVGEVVYAIVDVIVETEGPFEFKGACLAQILLLWIVIVFVHVYFFESYKFPLICIILNYLF